MAEGTRRSSCGFGEMLFDGRIDSCGVDLGCEYSLKSLTPWGLYSLRRIFLSDALLSLLYNYHVFTIETNTTSHLRVADWGLAAPLHGLDIFVGNLSLISWTESESACLP